MISNIGIPGLILILIIALIVFGPSKLPQIGKAMGQTLFEFKKSTNELVNDESTGQSITKNVDSKEVNGENN